MHSWRIDNTHRNMQGHGSLAGQPRPIECGAVPIAPARRWYVVQTTANAEEFVASTLRNQNFPVFLPREWTKPTPRPAQSGRSHHAPKPPRLRAAFPGYLFTQFCRESDPWRGIYRQPGVHRLLSSAPEQPTPVPDEAVEHLLANVSLSGAMPEPVNDEVEVGTLLTLASGPFAGQAAVVVRGLRQRGAIRVLLLAYGAEVEAAGAVVAK